MDAEIAAMLKQMGIPFELYRKPEGEAVWKAGESHPEFVKERLDVLVGNATALYRLGKEGEGTPDYDRAKALAKGAGQDLKPLFANGHCAYSAAQLAEAEAAFAEKAQQPRADC